MTKADFLIRTEMHNILGKRRPVQILTCTKRNCKTKMKSSRPVNVDEIIKSAKQKGWRINIAHHEAFCPEHALDKEEPMKTASIVPPVREMSQEERRKIFREIDDNYVAKSYIPKVNDKIIGLKLNVPWAWVAKIREENFGPEGIQEDPRLKTLEAEIMKLTLKIDNQENDVIRMSEACDEMKKQLVDLKGKLDEFVRSAQ